MLVAVMALGGCGSDDGSDTGSRSEAAPAPTTSTQAATASAFQADDIDFTFEIASGATQVDDDDGKLRAAVLLDPDETDDGIKVREAASQPLPAGTYIDTVRTQFSDDLEVPVDLNT